MKIVEYTVAQGVTVETLMSNVGYKIQHGWQPQGGIFQSQGAYFMQAMVRKAKGENDNRGEECRSNP